mgnify:CR=1 FL=1
MSLKNKVLFIVGPTATGKSALAIDLAKTFNGELISADSRQVYRGMDIGTGKLYSSEIAIHGYDLVSPDESFSVSHFHSFATKKIAEIIQNQKLPIVVGGTGFYVRSLLHPIETASIPQNEALRKVLSVLSVNDLLVRLMRSNKKKALALNESDRKNPARLIRAIEISEFGSVPQSDSIGYDPLVIGLSAPKEVLESRIYAAVLRRISDGFEEEVQSLLSQKNDFSSQAFTATGYKEMRAFIQKEITKEELIRQWTLSEMQYVKRQLTWFKKESLVQWVDITDPLCKTKVAETVERWHNNA